MKRKIVNSSDAGSKSGSDAGSSQGDPASYVPNEFMQSCFCTMFSGCMDGNIRKKMQGQTFFNNDASDPSAAADSELLEKQDFTKQADAALVQELNNLSVDERQVVYEDVHGISDRCKKETPELIRTSVQGVEAEIQNIARHDERKRTYNKALFFRPTYFKSEEFFLPFLRANDFNVRITAHRILDHLQLRHELMGWNGVLSKYVKIEEHFTEGAKRLVRTGRLQLLSQPDRSGRPVIVVFPKVQTPNYAPIDGVLVYWWFFDTVRRLFNTQRGVVLVLFDSGIQFQSVQQEQLMKDYYFSIDGLKLASRFVNSAAIFLSAIHFCYDNVKMGGPISAMQAILGRNGRVRFRGHCASATECLYTLMTFGIRVDSFPIDTDGKVQNTRFLAWLQGRLEAEEDERQKHSTRTVWLTAEEVHANQCKKAKRENAVASQGVLVQYPRETDVILGRGRPFQEHPGNLEVADMVDKYWPTYQRCARKEKMELTMQIVCDIQSEGRLFLRKYESADAANRDYGWLVVDDSKAREKVSHGFRNNTVYRKGGKGKGVGQARHLSLRADTVGTAADTPPLPSTQAGRNNEVVEQEQPVETAGLESTPVFSTDSHNTMISDASGERVRADNECSLSASTESIGHVETTVPISSHGKVGVCPNIIYEGLGASAISVEEMDMLDILNDEYS